MDKVTINEFKGLYTNVDEGSLNPEFQTKSVNISYKTGYIKSEGYKKTAVAGSGQNVLYSTPIRLDNDRYGTKLVDGELIADYEQNYEYFLLTARNPVEDVIEIYVDDIKVGTFEGIVPVKTIESEGTQKILMSDGSLYWLGRINRHFRGDETKTEIPFYFKKVFNYTNQIIANFTDDDGLPGTVTRYGKFIFNWDITRQGGGGTVAFFSFVADDGEILEQQILMEIGVPSSGENRVVIPSSTIKNKYVPVEGPWEDYFVDPIEGTILQSVLISLVFKGDITVVSPPIEGYNYRDIIVTLIYDDTNEYVVYAENKIYGVPQGDTRILGEIILNEGFNKKITAISVYIRYNKGDDYQQTHYFNLTTGINYKNYSEFTIDDLSGNGFYSSQTMGIVYDSSNYKPVFTFQDYIIIQGVAYGTHQSRTYFCSVGKGRIMKEVFYDYIPEVEGNFLVNVNGDLGIFSEQLELVSVQDSGEGYLLFAPKDSMNFRIRDQYDVATSPEGIIIHTIKGIYVTNGYERKLISEQINNIVEKNFSTGNIYYDKSEDILFYTCDEGTFKYDFPYQYWTELDSDAVFGIRGKLTFGHSGEVYETLNGKVSLLTKSEDVLSILKTPKMNLGYPDIAKNLIYLVIDFEGKVAYRDYYITHAEREEVKFGIPITEKVPSSVLDARLVFTGKIYSIEIHYDILGEFRNAHYIPASKTYPEGIPAVK